MRKDRLAWSAGVVSCHLLVGACAEPRVHVESQPTEAASDAAKPEAAPATSVDQADAASDARPVDGDGTDLSSAERLSRGALEAIRHGRAADAWKALGPLRSRNDLADAGISEELVQARDDAPKKMLVESDERVLWVAFNTGVLGFNVAWEVIWADRDGRVIEAMQRDVEDGTTPQVVRDSAGTLRAFSYEANSHGTGGAYTLWSLVEFPSEGDAGSVRRARDIGPNAVEKGSTEAWWCQPLVRKLCSRRHPGPAHGDQDDAILEYEVKFAPVIRNGRVEVGREGTIDCHEGGTMARSLSIKDTIVLDEATGGWRTLLSKPFSAWSGSCPQ